MSKMIAAILVLVASVVGGAGGFFAKQMIGGGEKSDKAEASSEDAHGSDKDEHGAGSHGEGNKMASTGHDSKKGGGQKHGAKKKGGGKKDAKKHGGGHGGKGGDASYSANNGLNYFKFSRQFIVPVIAEEGVSSLVILDLNLEMDDAAAESFYLREPKLRDALMAELLDVANEGRFNGVLTDRRNLDLIRQDLLSAMQDVEGDTVHDVLILDIMRQDMK